ncbi:MAG: hypothetical protein R2749_15250 [Acidimicrobiales bacterium]
MVTATTIPQRGQLDGSRALLNALEKWVDNVTMASFHPAQRVPSALARIAPTEASEAELDVERSERAPALEPATRRLSAASNTALQRSSVLQREPGDPVEEFNKKVPGHDFLVSALAGVTDPQIAFRNLVSAFFDRKDFTYTTNSKPSWGHAGDCATLAREFVEAVGFWGVKAELKTFKATVIYVSPRGIVDHSCDNGNIDDGTGGWIFETHTWVSTPYGEADILFGQLGPVDYSVGSEEDGGMVAVVNGTRYGLTEGAAHYKSRWSSDPKRWFGAKKK